MLIAPRSISTKNVSRERGFDKNIRSDRDVRNNRGANKDGSIGNDKNITTGKKVPKYVMEREIT